MLQLQLEMMPVFVINLVATPLSRPWAEKWQGVPISGLASCARLRSTAGQSDRMRPAARQLVPIHGRIRAICIYGSKVKGSAHRVSGARRTFPAVPIEPQLALCQRVVCRGAVLPRTTIDSRRTALRYPPNRRGRERNRVSKCLLSRSSSATPWLRTVPLARRSPIGLQAAGAGATSKKLYSLDTPVGATPDLSSVASTQFHP